MKSAISRSQLTGAYLPISLVSNGLQEVFYRDLAKTFRGPRVKQAEVGKLLLPLQIRKLAVIILVMMYCIKVCKHLGLQVKLTRHASS